MLLLNCIGRLYYKFLLQLKSEATERMDSSTTLFLLAIQTLGMRWAGGWYLATICSYIYTPHTQKLLGHRSVCGRVSDESVIDSSFSEHISLVSVHSDGTRAAPL